MGTKPGILLVATLLGASSILTAGNAHESEDNHRCEETKQKIRKIQSQMRQGYSASRGIRLEARLRELRELRRKQCR